jgi:magnesium transporter
MLVNCVLYKQGMKSADIKVEDIDVALRDPLAFVWVAFNEPSETEIASIAEEFSLHPLAIEDAMKGHQRPKIEEYDETLFVVLKPAEWYAERGEKLHFGEVHLFVGKQFIVSLRRGVAKGFGNVRKRCESEPENLQKGAGFVQYAIMDEVVDRYFPVIEALEAELEVLEEHILHRQHLRATLAKLYRLKIDTLSLRHVITPLLEATGKLTGGRVPIVAQGSTEYFRDVYDHLTRIHAAVDDLRETINTALTVNVSMSSLESAEQGKKLTAYAAMIAAPTLLAGIWGMNFKHMPELDWVWGYPMALGLMLTTVLTIRRQFKKAKWI